MRDLLKEVAQDPLAMFYAVLVHVALAAVLFVSLDWHEIPQPASPKVNIVQAVVVSEKQVQAELEKLKKAESLEQKKAEAQRKKEEARKRKLEREMRETEKKRKAEERRLAQLKKEREAENRRKKEAEKKRKVEEKRLATKKAEEQKKLERMKAEQAALEKKRKVEEKRLAEMVVKRQQEKEAARKRALAEKEAARKRAEEERKRREQEAAMRAEIAAEQAQLDAEKRRRLDSLRAQYIAAIAGKVERHWLKPPSARAGLSCKVRVKQIPGGEVIDVQVTQCTGDNTFRRSVETAVKKSSPLPMPKDPRLFEREIIFNFKPQ
ncbi:MAG TPA: cell envelope integrity protein TolA [Chromatiales bacterium]|nr:cell envelope integrity protein TolA [Chromatiales bacterium]HEX22522.1 cell envelope integrity protein TolA [Chromatiales bacterium]